MLTSEELNHWIGHVEGLSHIWLTCFPFFFFFFFIICFETCGILSPWPGMNPKSGSESCWPIHFNLPSLRLRMWSNISLERSFLKSQSPKSWIKAFWPHKWMNIRVLFASFLYISMLHILLGLSRSTFCHLAPCSLPLYGIFHPLPVGFIQWKALPGDPGQRKITGF